MKVVAGQHTITLRGSVIAIYDIKLDSFYLKRMKENDIDALRSGEETSSVRGRPVFYTFTNTNLSRAEIKLYPIPDKEYELKISASELIEL